MWILEIHCKKINVNNVSIYVYINVLVNTAYAYIYISILLVLVICVFLCYDIITVCDNQWFKSNENMKNQNHYIIHAC